MVKPLHSLLRSDGLTPFGQQIFNREPIDPNLPINEGTRLLLENQYNKIPKLHNTEHALEFELLMKGLKNGLNEWQHHHLADTWEYTNRS